MNVGIVGCGNIAQSHVRILRRNLGNPRLVFCDGNREKAETMAATFWPGSTYRTVDDLLSAEKLDAVHILTPVPSHAALAEKTLAAGVHTYVEKPVAEKACEYTALLALAKSRGRLLCAGYSSLGIPVVRKAKAIINSGRFGKLLTVHCDFNWSSPGNTIPYGHPDHWAYSLKGGILQNLVDHPTSLIVDAMDEIKDHRVLFSRRNPLPNNCPDLVHVSVKNDYQVGSFTISFGHGNTGGHVAYFLESAVILIDLRRELLAILPDSNGRSSTQKALSGLQWSWDIGRGTVASIVARLTGTSQREPGIVGLIRNFYRAIDGTENLIVGELTATRIVALLEELWEELSQSR